MNGAGISAAARQAEGHLFPARFTPARAGRIVACDTPRRVGSHLKAMGHDMFVAMPAPMRPNPIMPIFMAFPLGF